MTVMRRGSAKAATGERLLRREIAAVLLFKFVAMSALWYLFFSPAHVVTVTPATVGAALFAAPTAAPVSKPGR